MMKKTLSVVAVLTAVVMLMMAVPGVVYAAPEGGEEAENLFSPGDFLQSYFREDETRPGTFTNGGVTTGSETFRTPGLTRNYTFGGHVKIVKIGSQPWNGIRVIIGESAAGSDKLVVTKAMDTRLEFKGGNVGDAVYRAVSLPLADGTEFDFRVEREGSHVLFYLNDRLQADLTVDPSLDTFDENGGSNLGFEASECHLEISDIIVTCPDAQRTPETQPGEADTEPAGEGEINMQTVTHLTATDALERTTAAVDGFRQDKFVGLFYFAWFNSPVPSQREVHDITKILREDPDELFSMNSSKYPMVEFYYFNEPLYGYYSSTDDYVIRKHLELFIAADVDFIALDFTNAIYYGETLQKMLDIYLEYQQAGWKVPQFTLFTNANSASIITRAYKDFYASGKYDSLWFRADGEKPYMIGRAEDLSPALQEYFTVRPAQWPNEPYMENGWPYVDLKKPQPVYADNLMSASVAQQSGNAFSFSLRGPSGQIMQSQGRGFTRKKHRNGNIEAILAGENLQEEFDTAIEKDAKILFVTGWNEWIAQKLSADWSEVPYWVDTFNTEFSRDIEMTKAAGYVPDGNGGYSEEGYGDNYYIQLVDNIRRFKGVAADPARSDKNVEYLNIATTGYGRDSYGILRTEDCYYTQAAPVNFVRSITLDHDDESLLMTITCAEEIRYLSAEGTLNVLIGLRGSENPAWEHFQYKIGSYQNGSASLTAFDGDAWKEIGKVSYTASGSVLSLTIPREAVGASGSFDLYFKVTDSIDSPSEILDYYVSGCSAPLGRLAYTYTVIQPERETETEAPDTTPATAPDTLPDTEPAAGPATEAPTAAPGTDAPAEETTGAADEGGCKSMLGAASLILTAAAAGAALTKKKKD